MGGVTPLHKPEHMEPWGPTAVTEVIIVPRCRNCGHIWHYEGRTPHAQCARCRTSNNLKDPEVETLYLRLRGDSV